MHRHNTLVNNEAFWPISTDWATPGGQKCQKEAILATFLLLFTKSVQSGIPPQIGISRTVPSRSGPLLAGFTPFGGPYEVSFGSPDPKSDPFPKGAENSPLGAPRFRRYRHGVVTSDVGEPSHKNKIN